MKQLFLLLALFSNVIVGCSVSEEMDDTSTATSASDKHEYLIEVNQGSDGSDFVAVFPDGSQMNDLDRFSLYLPTLQQWANDNDYELVIRLTETFDDSQSELTENDDNTVENPLVQQVGEYTLSASGGEADFFQARCIRARGTYYAIRLNYGSNRNNNARQIFDIHFVKYNSGGRACLAVYESVSFFCQSLCEPPSIRWVRDNIYNIAIAAGVGAGTAYLISIIGTPLVGVALAI